MKPTAEDKPIVDFKKINKVRVRDSIVPVDDDLKKFVRKRRTAKALHTPQSMFIQTHMLNSKEQIECWKQGVNMHDLSFSENYDQTIDQSSIG